MGYRTDDGVAPVHEGDLLILSKVLGIGLRDKDLGAVGNFLGAQRGVLAVFGFVFGERGETSAFHCGGHDVFLWDGGMSRGNRINVFLVCSPESCPIEGYQISAGTLFEDELS